MRYIGWHKKWQPGREKVNSLPLLVFSVDYIYFKLRWSQLLSFKLIFNYQILIRFNSNISEMISNVFKENDLIIHRKVK